MKSSLGIDETGWFIEYQGNHQNLFFYPNNTFYFSEGHCLVLQ